MTDTPTTTAKIPRHCITCGSPSGVHLSWCPALATAPAQTGWLCPACGRGNAPINMTCPCKGWPEMRITC